MPRSRAPRGAIAVAIVVTVAACCAAMRVAPAVAADGPGAPEPVAAGREKAAGKDADTGTSKDKKADARTEPQRLDRAVVYRYDPIQAKLVAVRPAEIKPDHVYYRFSAAKNRHVWSKAVGQGRFRYAMGPGSVQPARLFDIRATEEEKQKALESRAPLAAKLYASQGAQPALRLDDADRWSVAIVPTDGSVFDVETGRRFEWHGDRAVEVAHSGGNSWTRRGDRYAPARPDPISMDPIPACW